MVTSKAAKSVKSQSANLSQVLAAIWEAGSLDQAIMTGLDSIQAEFDHSLIWVGLHDRTHHQLTTRGLIAPKREHFPSISLAIHPGDVMEQVLIQQRPLVIPDLKLEPRAGAWARIAEKLGLQGTVILPIRRRDVCFGVLVLSSPRWGVTSGLLENATLSTVTRALAEAMHQHIQEQQRQQVKQPAQPLLTLLEDLGKLSGLDQRLGAVVEATRRFTDSQQTSIYWFESRGRYFWQRVGGQARRPLAVVEKAANSRSRISVEQIKDAYQMLLADQLVVLEEAAEGSLKAGLALRLKQLLEAPSLMASPILCRGELLGFLAVSGASGRVWSETDQQFVQGAARLVSLSLPAAELEQILEQVKSDQLLTAGLTRSIHSDGDWRRVLELCSSQLAARIGVDRLIVLSADPVHGGFEVRHISGKRLTGIAAQRHWPILADVDRQMLERSHAPIGVEQIEDNLKLIAWRPRLLEMGIQSLLVCNVSPGQAPRGLVLVADSVSRHWSQAERELVQAVSQQLGLILHQWQLQRQASQQAQMYDTLQWGLRNLQRLFQIDLLDQAGTKHIAQLLQVPLVALVAWPNGDARARIASAMVRDKKFKIDPQAAIDVQSDALINWAAHTDGLLSLSLEDLTDETRAWISGPEACQVLVMALRTAPEHEPNAVMVLADRSDRRWSDEQTTLLAMVVNQLAWCRRHLNLTGQLAIQGQQLSELNWYKQHHLDSMEQLLNQSLEPLKVLLAGVESQLGQRQQQAIHQLMSLNNRLVRLNQYERWELQPGQETMAIVGLIKRLMERANPLIQSRQLWTKVHCESNLSLGGDITKIEFVLYELIAAACDRSPPGSRIDVWCRPFDDRWLEVSITDSGLINAELIQELQRGRPTDLLSSTLLNQSEGRHFHICQSLMKQLGGEFILAQMDDQRTLSRVILPLDNP